MPVEYKTHQQRLQARIKQCLSCGRTYIAGSTENPDFCHLRCETWLKQGNPSYLQQMEHLKDIKNCKISWDYDFMFNEV